MTRIVYGYTAYATRAHVLARMSVLVSRCGRDIVVVPDPQPTDPQVCVRCAQYAGLVQPNRESGPRRGECPECGGDVPLDDNGRTKAHRQYRVGPGGVYRSQAPCPGKGLEPAGE